MKLLTWAVFAFAVLLWTGALAVLGATVHWGVGLLGSGQLLDVGKAMAAVPLPAWLTLWVDAGQLSAWLHAVVVALEWLQQAWPGVAAALNWLVPALWVVWGLGLLLLLAAATGLYALVGRTSGISRSGTAHRGAAG